MREAGDPVQMPTPAVLPGGCLVLVPPSSPVPAELLKALMARGFASVVVHDEPSVMCALADHSHQRRVLVIVEPGRWKRLLELVLALRTYHASVLCWAYRAEEGLPGKLVSIDDIELSVLNKDGKEMVPTMHRRRPIHDLVNKLPDPPLTSREVVTQQELTMLLGPSPGEAS